MVDYIVYHNPDSMGYPASQVTKLEIVTDKQVKSAIGSRVWLLTGEGRPRRFYIRGYFVVDVIDSGDEDGFRTRLSGADGRLFEPMLDLTDESWFPELMRRQGNFAFGLQRIGDEKIVRCLEDFTAGATSRATTRN